MGKSSVIIPEINTTIVTLSGLIQGIGFRPFVYRQAKQNKLNGIVYNRNNGVIIHIQGEKTDIQKFLNQLFTLKPAAADIQQIESIETTLPAYSNFRIEESEDSGNEITRVSPDIAVCNDCLEDLKDQPHRQGYPFTNCTHCGPRFSIIENLPYDRESTSMKNFQMCPQCQQEYSDTGDRRFHAQPVACNNCGPKYCLYFENSKIVEFDKILDRLELHLSRHEVIAIKGLGGYHLVCDAGSEAALKKLRQLKLRDGKPFAIMAADIDSARKIAVINVEEEKVLESWQRPIVILEEKLKGQFPEQLTGKLNTLGIILPYLPFHHLLFRKIKTRYLVFTSANLSNNPLIIKDEEALNYFADKIPVLTHNREIINRLDDSVVSSSTGNMQIIRRARGYVPNPFYLNRAIDGIFAAGAELSNTFCIGKGNQAMLSQHIGDLKNAQTLDFYTEAYHRFCKLFRFEPRLAACDMHPDYLSTAFAESMGIPVIKVQHHHAHIAACMTEYRIAEPVIGVSYDGTGYGTDGNSWGGEILIADFKDFERKYQFEYVPIPGGDRATDEPWRSAIAYLFSAFDGQIPFELPFLKNISGEHVKLTLTALEKQINTPLSSSAGRLFDAVSSILNICTHATYHAEAPILLENFTLNGCNEVYNMEIDPILSWKNVIRQIVTDLLENNIPVNRISARFHNTLAHITYQLVQKTSTDTGIKKLVLSGGVFQNRYLAKKTVDLFNKSGMQVYIPSQIPCNDGGISLGQLVIASKKS